ncbi:MAG: hypothetical protein RLY93_09500 [Sumerlaeia bacterium]
MNTLTRTFAQATLAAAALAIPFSLSAREVLYETSFESAEGFTANTYDADTAGSSVAVGDSWSLLAGIAEVVASGETPDSSAQIVRLRDGAQLDRDLSGEVATSDNEVFVEGYFRGAGSGVSLADASYPADQSASAIVHFSSADGIQLLDGNGAGSGTPVNTSVALGTANEDTWYKLTLFLDFTSQEWDAYVMEEGSATVTKLNTQAPLGFRDNVTSLNGFRNLAQTASEFDGFRVVKPILGDANGDSLKDGADVVRILEFALNDVTDPILSYNADYNGVGGVTEDDAMILASDLTTGN